MIKPSRINWGFLGTARINQAMIDALQSSKFSRLLAVGSRSRERGREYALHNNIAHVHGSYDELLADPDIDIIYNSLPNDLHASWSIKAAQAGKNVLCEKPFALSSIDAGNMAKAARDNNVLLTEALVYRHFPQTSKITEIVHEGLLGNIQLMRGSFSFILNRPDDFRWKPGQGGGSLWDVGCYPISYIHMVAGVPPFKVQGWQITAPSGVDSAFSGQLLFNDGLIAQFDCSFSLPRYQYMEIRGSLGTLIIPNPFNSSQENHITLRQGEKETNFSFPPHNRFQHQVQDIEISIRDGKPLLISPEESVQMVSTLETLAKSAHENGLELFGEPALPKSDSL
jgi:xylose dehydrogenase (NAD/NADP)